MTYRWSLVSLVVVAACAPNPGTRQAVERSAYPRLSVPLPTYSHVLCGDETPPAPGLISERDIIRLGVGARDIACERLSADLYRKEGERWWNVTVYRGDGCAYSRYFNARTGEESDSRSDACP